MVKMIEINIDPYIFRAGTFGLMWSSLIEIVAIALALYLFIIKAKKYGLEKKHIIWLSILFVVAGYIGGRLLALIEMYYFLHVIDPIGLRARMPGVVIGTTVVMLLYARISKLSTWQLLDMGAPALYLFIALYRIGCVVNGCCYGLPCDLPWAVIYTNPHTISPQGISEHPTQLYHLIWTAIVFVSLIQIQKKPLPAGFATLSALLLYSIGDFIIRFFRADEPVVFNISISQVAALLQIVICAYFLFSRRKTFKQIAFRKVAKQA